MLVTDSALGTMFSSPQRTWKTPHPSAVGWMQGTVCLMRHEVLGGLSISAKCCGDSRSMQRQPMRRQRAYASREDSLENWSPVRYLQRRKRDHQQPGLPRPG